MPVEKIEIHSMGKEQKISRRTIEMGVDYERTQYLLSLNSVFEISKIRFRFEKKEKNHLIHPRIWCWSCWKSGFQMNKSGRELRKSTHKMYTAYKVCMSNRKYFIGAQDSTGKYFPFFHFI
jgi:hypothetical protein